MSKIEMSEPERLARGVIAGDLAIITQVREMINQDKSGGVLFALRLIWKIDLRDNDGKPKRNTHVADLVWNSLKEDGLDQKNPHLVSDLLVLLALHQPEFLSGAARKIFPETRNAQILFDTTVTFQNMLQKELL